MAHRLAPSLARVRRPRRPSSLLLALGPVLALFGCAPEIGDECTTSVDCSAQGDRLCDTTQPGGYCTIFNCEPDTCPEDESHCVAFRHRLDPACQSAQPWARFERTFCMKSCEDDGDCRDGYTCAKLPLCSAPYTPNAYDACVADREVEVDGICALPASAPAPSLPEEEPAVCGPADAGADAPAPDGGAGDAGDDAELDAGIPDLGLPDL